MKWISVFPGIVLEISIDALIACCLWWDGYLKVNHCGSHDPWLAPYKSAWLNPVTEEELSCKRKIENAHDTHVLAMRNIIDEDIKTFGHVQLVPRKISAGTRLVSQRPTLKTLFLGSGAVRLAPNMRSSIFSRRGNYCSILHVYCQRESPMLLGFATA